MRVSKKTKCVTVLSSSWTSLALGQLEILAMWVAWKIPHVVSENLFSRAEVTSVSHICTSQKVSLLFTFLKWGPSQARNKPYNYVSCNSKTTRAWNGIKVIHLELNKEEFNLQSVSVCHRPATTYAFWNERKLRQKNAYVDWILVGTQEWSVAFCGHLILLLSCPA